MKRTLAVLMLMLSAMKILASAQVPELLAPAQDEVLDNGCENRSDNKIWEFSWSPVDGARRYHIFVQRLGSQFPVLNHAVNSPSYTFEGKGYVAPHNTEGWTWRVRAQTNGTWGQWSPPRSFIVEPMNTDCR